MRLKKRTARGFIWQIDDVAIGFSTFFAIFGGLTVFLLVLGQLTSGLAVLCFIVSTLGASYFAYWSQRKRTRELVIKKSLKIDIVVVVGLIVWGGISAFYSAQNIFIYRDPGIYSVTAAILIDEHKLDIQKASVFGNVSELQSVSAGFGNDLSDTGKLFAQGQHLFPVLLGLFGRAVGESGMFLFNAICGSLALFVIYAFARRIVRPGWAVLATLMVSLSWPMLYFSRDNYTEPLSLLFTFSTLLAIHRAQLSRKLSDWLLPGILAGAATLVRPDGYLLIVAIALYSSFYLFTAPSDLHKSRLAQTTLMVGSSGLVALIGWLDITLNSSGYYADAGVQIKQQLFVLVSVIVATAVFTPLAWKIKLSENNKVAIKRILLPAVTLITVGLTILLSTRPFWYVARKESPSQAVVSMQVSVGQSVDPYRTYAEQTVTWLGYYMGPLLLLFAATGMVIVVRRVVVSKDGLLYLPLLLVVSMYSALLLNIPGIAPDQPWAMRRFLPVVIPGLAIFCAIALESVYKKLLSSKGFFVRYGLLSVVLISLLLPILYISQPFLRLRSYGGQLEQIKTICSHIPKDGGLIWVGSSYQSGIQTVRAYCDVPSVGLSQLSSISLRKIAETETLSGEILVVGTEDFSNDILKSNQISQLKYLTANSTFMRPPREVITNTRNVYGAILQEDGTLRSLDR